MQNPILKKWKEHRELTEKALSGQSAHFKTSYGYLPKCIHGSRRAYRKDDSI